MIDFFPKRLKQGLLFITPLLFLLLSSCRDRDLIRPGDTVEVAVKKANKLFQDERYGQAAEAYEVVVSIARGTDIGKEAQFMLARSYYKNEQYLIAASEFERYRNLYPRDPKRQEADFLNALCHYHLSPRYKLDQTYTKKAIELFNLYISRYPDADRVMDADGYILELRNKLARKAYNAADLYMRMRSYRAAAIYYGVTIDEYPESEWGQKALAEQIYTYNIYAENSIADKQYERYLKAEEAYQKFVQLFPRGKYRQDAEEYYEDTIEALNELEEGRNVAQQQSAQTDPNDS